MIPWTASLLATAALEPAGAMPLQIFDALADSSRGTRGGVAFALVFGVGMAVQWHDEAFLDRGRDASAAHPLRSVGYGIAVHAVVLFAGVYLATRLARYTDIGTTSGLIGIGVALFVIGVVGGIGFSVIGSAIVTLSEYDYAVAPPAVGALIAAGIAVLPTDFAGVLWFGLISVGIGGSVREWYHASAVEEIKAEQSS